MGGFLFQRRGGLPRETVTFTLAGTATQGVDYADFGSSVVIPPQHEVYWLALAPDRPALPQAVVPLDDALAEGTETIELRIDGEPALPATLLVFDDEPDPRLGAEYPLDEGSGAIAFDTSGNGHHAVLLPSGSGPTWEPRQSGQGLAFDGFDDYLRIGDFDVSPEGALTLAFWFNAASTGGTSYEYVYSHGGVGAAQSLNVYFIESDGRLRTRLQYASNLTASNVLDVHRDYRDGNWHLYTLTSAPGQLTRVYVDAELVAETFVAGDLLDPAGDVFVGARQDLDPDRFYTGRIDGLRLFSRSVPRDEIATWIP